ncbi:30S ribosomal protein S13 [Patescibacteria group bacterium]|nr:30S ribosomal protein S13 [Patescibacteria group bacterium]
MAARIAGVTLPPNKNIIISLSYIFGIGLTLSRKILEEAKINENAKTDSLNDAEVNKLRDIIENKYRVEGELKREILLNIKRLKEIGTYRGSRHAKGLPVRGQRTKTNNRTVRGNVRKTMGSGRRLASDKK